MEDDTCQCKQESKEMHLMWVYLQSVLWICHISNVSMFATTPHVLHLCECAADVTSSLLSSIWCKSSGKTHTWIWQLNAVLCNTFHRQKDSTWRLETTEMKDLIFHVIVFFPLFLCVTVWPNLFFWACRGKAAHPAKHDWGGVKSALKSSFSYPLPTFLLRSRVHWRCGCRSLPQTLGQIEASRLRTCHRWGLSYANFTSCHRSTAPLYNCCGDTVKYGQNICCGQWIYPILFNMIHSHWSFWIFFKKKCKQWKTQKQKIC